MLSAHSINDRHSEIFRYLQGNLDIVATQCNTPGEASETSLVFITDVCQLTAVRLHRPAILILHAELAAALPELPDTPSCYFSAPSIPMAMTALLTYFDQKPIRFTQWGGHHATAVVHADASVGDEVLLGPYCVIGSHAVIGARTLIGSHVVIENGARIGARCIIHPHVFIGASCRIGDDCEIHPHTTIGGDGFGYAVGADGRPRKIPHLGNVVIGDGVEIGSNCAVDRATLTSTHIRSGTKLDNICHIAHNCDLGENGLFAAGFMMGGSTKIGRRFATGGNSVVTAHVTVADNVSLAGRSTVTNNVPVPGVYGGYPLQPLAEAMKNLVHVGRLNELSRNLNRVMKYLNISHDKPAKPACAAAPLGVALEVEPVAVEASSAIG